MNEDWTDHREKFNFENQQKWKKYLEESKKREQEKGGELGAVRCFSFIYSAFMKALIH